MKKLLVTLFVSMLSAGIYAVAPAVQTQIYTIPKVSSWKDATGNFLLTQDVVVNVSDTTLNHVKEYMKKSLGLMMARKSGHSNGIINLTVKHNKRLGNEGYTIDINKNQIDVVGNSTNAVLWGVQTLLQMSEHSEQLPCGQITDEPDYRLRGFMIDCARKFIPMDYLYQLVVTMSYYKMNTLQIHLNDNGFPKYYNNNWSETYSAFRLESEKFPRLTASDGHYGKEEFKQFIRYAEKLGVEIIPEIDVPAHSLAFTKIRPKLKGYKADHMDISNPQTTAFIDSLFSEYLEGPDPVFCCKKVHIGTDEYNNTEQDVVEDFRALTDHLIKFVESYGKQAVLWGSLTHADGDTPVKVDNVLMDMWSNSYADPIEMKRAGYQMICIPDAYTYIVPAAGYYYDYLNYRNLYLHWTPAVFGQQEKYQFKERDPQIEGGMFAEWNDICGNGISVGDIHHRVFPALQVIAEKTWRAEQEFTSAAGAYARWNKMRQLMGEGPGVDELGDFEGTLDTLPANTALRSNVQPHYQLGYDYKVEFDIEWGKELDGTCLTTSRRAKFYLCDPISRMMGFSRDGYLYTFPHSGRPGVKEHITIIGTNRSTKLLVDGVLIKELNYEQHMDASNKPYNVVRTLVFPLENTGNYNSKITNFNAYHINKNR